jgi:hypothetical protein
MEAKVRPYRNGLKSINVFVIKVDDRQKAAGNCKITPRSLKVRYKKYSDVSEKFRCH